MSKKTIIPSAELTRELLPALRMMVRFPTRSEKVASFNTGLDLERLMAWTRAHGRPTADTLGAVMRAQGGFDREPETWIKGGPMGRPRADAPRMTLEQASTPANIPQLPSRPLGRGGLASPAPVREVRTVVVPAPPVVIAPATPEDATEARWTASRVKAVTLRAYLPAVELWLAQPSLPATEVAAAHGMALNTLSQWKSNTFGPGYGRPTSAVLAKWAVWARRRLGLDSAPNNPAAEEPRTNEVEAAAPIPAPPAQLWQLAGKERRHLVASVVVGLLVARRVGPVGDEAKLVAEAFAVVEEIVRQDAQVVAKGGAA